MSFKEILVNSKKKFSKYVVTCVTLIMPVKCTSIRAGLVNLCKKLRKISNSSIAFISVWESIRLLLSTP